MRLSSIYAFACAAFAATSCSVESVRFSLPGQLPADGGPDAAPDAVPDGPAAPLCGNGRPDPGETCDDGNNVLGDTCDIECGASTRTYAKASNTDSFDIFGYRIAISADGTTVAIGAYQESSASAGVNGDPYNNNLAQSGAVYVYVRTGAVWAVQAYLKASNPGFVDLFGISLALSADGNTLAVGAPLEDSGAIGVGGPQSDGVTDSGAAYVFARTGTTWRQQAYVKATNTGADDQFGTVVALSGDGNTLAVSAPSEDSNAVGVGGAQANDGAIDAGAVYTFTRSAGEWSAHAYLKASNSEMSDQFGRALALSGDGLTLAAGTGLEDGGSAGVNGANNNSLGNAGAAYVFARTAASWRQQAYVKASNVGRDDEFGTALALSRDGATLAVGAPAEDSAATGVGGDQESSAASNSGAVYLLVRSGETWTQQAYLKATNTDVSDVFGSSVALAGNGSLLVVGAPLEDSSAVGVGGDGANNNFASAGSAYLYGRTGSSWQPLRYLKATNTGSGDSFGTSAVLAEDGGTVAVGAPNEAGAGRGTGGDPLSNTASGAGAVYLYR